jgi:predicted ATP-grasp superfamily ATP-dependent carboligase
MVRPAAFVFRDNLAALAACRELGRAGIEVHVFDATPGPAAQSRFSRFTRAPSYYDDPTGWARFVRAQAARFIEAPVLFPTEDAALLVADRFHAELSPVVRYSYQAPGPALSLLDKRRLYAAAAAIGAPVPRCVAVDDGSALRALENADDWIAKPACRYWFNATGKRIHTFLQLTGGSKAIEGDVRVAARRVLEAGFPAILQERIPGPFENLFSIGLAIDRDGTLVASFCSRKHGEYPEPFGDGLIVETVACDEDLVERTVALLRRVGYWGICDVEFKLDERDGRFKILDANPRVWLWMGLGALTGAPLALHAYALASGDHSVLPETPRTDASKSWVSPRGAAAFLLKAWRPHRHGWALGMRVAAGALHTVGRDLATFRDPLYVKPGAWSSVVRALSRPR